MLGRVRYKADSQEDFHWMGTITPYLAAPHGRLPVRSAKSLVETQPRFETTVDRKLLLLLFYLNKWRAGRP